jgi:hypothetical protein
VIEHNEDPAVLKALLAFVDDYTRPHWNVEIPGSWQPSRSVKGVGSYIGRYVSSRPGVYRLAAMTDVKARQAMVLNRIGGSDSTGTLYIGCASSLRFRLQQLMRSLREPRKHRYLGEHHAGRGLRGSRVLNKLFPRECLVVYYAYNRHPEIYEKNLLGHYALCFGELPPLNNKPGHGWFELD